MARCEVCFHRCEIPEGRYGACGARTCREGVVVSAGYAKVTALALDPVEKKPLRRFFPGKKLLSVGSFGCNLACPYCQNWEIASREEAWRYRDLEEISARELAKRAALLVPYGNVGLAFTYNEPLVGYEYVYDAALEAKRLGLVNVLVTNGCVSSWVLEKLLPVVDAMNIDLKGFTPQYYSQFLKGNLAMVQEFISLAVGRCHVELTTLVVPGYNDGEEQMRSLSSWVSSLTDLQGRRVGEEVPLHISRFFPRHRMQDASPTSVEQIYHLREVAREKLRFVYTGNC